MLAASDIQPIWLTPDTYRPLVLSKMLVAPATAAEPSCTQPAVIGPDSTWFLPAGAVQNATVPEAVAIVTLMACLRSGGAGAGAGLCAGLVVTPSGGQREVSVPPSPRTSPPERGPLGPHPLPPRGCWGRQRSPAPVTPKSV